MCLIGAAAKAQAADSILCRQISGRCIHGPTFCKVLTLMGKCYSVLLVPARPLVSQSRTCLLSIYPGRLDASAVLLLSSGSLQAYACIVWVHDVNADLCSDTTLFTCAQGLLLPRIICDKGIRYSSDSMQVALQQLHASRLPHEGLKSALHVINESLCSDWYVKSHSNSVENTASSSLSRVCRQFSCIVKWYILCRGVSRPSKRDNERKP